MCFQFNMLRMTKLMLNHPLFSFNILNDKTKFDLAIIGAKDRRQRDIDDAVRQYFDWIIPTTELEYLRDNYDKVMGVYYKKQDRYLKRKNVCGVCSVKASKICPICNQITYCSETCQRSDWGHHKHHCHLMGLTRLGVLYCFGKDDWIQELLDWRTEHRRVKDRRQTKQELAIEIKLAEQKYEMEMLEIRHRW